MVSYADALASTDCEKIRTTERKRDILCAGFVDCMGIKKLPNHAMVREL